MDQKKPYNPSLHGWKSMTILCPDDVCKDKKEKEEVMHGEDEGRANQKLENLWTEGYE